MWAQVPGVSPNSPFMFSSITWTEVPSMSRVIEADGAMKMRAELSCRAELYWMPWYWVCSWPIIARNDQGRLASPSPSSSSMTWGLPRRGSSMSPWPSRSTSTMTSAALVRRACGPPSRRPIWADEPFPCR